MIVGTTPDHAAKSREPQYLPERPLTSICSSRKFAHVPSPEVLLSSVNVAARKLIELIARAVVRQALQRARAADDARRAASTTTDRSGEEPASAIARREDLSDDPRRD
jgi:hypothetical protein